MQRSLGYLTSLVSLLPVFFLFTFPLSTIMYTVLLNQIIKIANLFNNSAKSEVGKHGFIVVLFNL